MFICRFNDGSYLGKNEDGDYVRVANRKDAYEVPTFELLDPSTGFEEAAEVIASKFGLLYEFI